MNTMSKIIEEFRIKAYAIIEKELKHIEPDDNDVSKIGQTTLQYMIASKTGLSLSQIRGIIAHCMEVNMLHETEIKGKLYYIKGAKR